MPFFFEGFLINAYKSFFLVLAAYNFLFMSLAFVSTKFVRVEITPYNIHFSLYLKRLKSNILDVTRMNQSCKDLNRTTKIKRKSYIFI